MNAKIQELITYFDNNKNAILSGWNEETTRIELINPFFECLGWDVNNNQQLADPFKEVKHEENLKIGTNMKAPDYSFNYGKRLFYLEAKKPAINIKTDISPAYQLRRYGWTAKLPISILSDFEELAIYDCRIKPGHNDSACIARIKYYTYKDYIDKWDEIYGFISKEAVLHGSLNDFENKQIKGTASIDDDFLNSIEKWRKVLALNIALRNPDLTEHELNFAIQMIIDRIIFLRICEDRGIENYGLLKDSTNNNAYEHLLDIFRRADEKYNSGLFHFTKEKERDEIPDTITPRLKIDDKALKEIIRDLYYPECPYELSVISGDVLGSVYERFLGNVIRLTDGHHAKIEEKPEVRKAGGVYYTPHYIVEYIVRNTVGEILKDKTPAQAAALKILDPACGSGSFLIEAYQYLLDWHLDYYIQNDPDKWKKGKEPKLFDSRTGLHLTLSERKRILVNNIFGVDIDKNAVEVTKLSLLLKVLEYEGREVQQKSLFNERILPDLYHNIKCGNSLIGSDFYTDKDVSLFGSDEMDKINTFDWHTAFPEVFGTAPLRLRSGNAPGDRTVSGAELSAASGFDAVIGNPPYVRQELLTEKDYFQKKYEVYTGAADLYSYFIERGYTLLRDNGLFSIIVSNKWMRANYGQALRKWMKTKHIGEIVDFGDLPVFQNATTYPCILTLSKSAPNEQIPVTNVKTLEFAELKEYTVSNSFTLERKHLADEGWTLADGKVIELMDKIKSMGVPLEKYVEGKIYRGVLTGLNEAFVISQETREKLIAEDPKSAEIIKPFLVGKDIKRYQPLNSDKFLIFFPKGWTNTHSAGEKNKWEWLTQKYPAVTAYLKQYENAAKKRCDQGDYWWELRACDYYEEFEKPKIFLPDISLRGNFSIDSNGGIYCVNTAYIIGSNDTSLLAILNSKLITFYYKNISSTYRGGYLRFIYQYIALLPIKTTPDLNHELHNKLVSLVDQMLETQKQLREAKTDNDKKILRQKTEIIDRQIDALVCELYGLTEDEIKIVEGE